GMELLFECLTQPNFPKDAFNRERARQLNDIDEAEQLPDTRASVVFHEMVYGKHPLGRPALGSRKVGEKLTPEDCAAFHRQVFVPNNTLLAVVGDFDSKQVIEEVKQLTAGWKKAELPKLALPEVALPKEFTEQIVTMPDAAQLHFFMGHPGIRRND